jgi:hypothetical protein
VREIPVDATQVQMISTGTVTPVMAWTGEGDSRKMSDQQERDEQGRAVWRVEVIVPGDSDDERDRTSVSDVTIRSHERPDPGAFGDVLQFVGLRLSLPYLQKRTGTLSPLRWSAEGIRRPQVKAA